MIRHAFVRYKGIRGGGGAKSQKFSPFVCRRCRRKIREGDIYTLERERDYIHAYTDQTPQKSIIYHRKIRVTFLFSFWGGGRGGGGAENPSKRNFLYIFI